MNRMVIDSRVGPDGILHIPVGSDAANKDVRVTIEAAEISSGKELMSAEEWRAFLKSTAGAWQGDFDRPPQGPLQERDPFP